MKLAVIKAALLAACLISPVALAQETPPQDLPTAAYTQWVLLGYVERLSFDKNAAAQEGIEPEAWALGFAGEHHSTAHRYTTRLGAAFIGYDDNAEFRQQVQSGRRVSTASSEASAFQLFAEVGPRFELGETQNFFATLRGGMSVIVASSRDIPACSNCYSEDIDIKGGLYGVAGVGVYAGSLAWSLEYKQFFSGDQNDALSLVLSGRF